MFDKLVVSSNERRRNIAARFLLGTSLVYMFSAACVVALSIIVSNPQMADTGMNSTAKLIVPVAQAGQPEVQPAGQPAQPSARDDYSNPLPLDKVLSESGDSSALRERVNIPQVDGPIGEGGGVTGGSTFAVPVAGPPNGGEGNEDLNNKDRGAAQAGAGCCPEAARRRA